MTALLSPPVRPSSHARHRRPLLLVTLLGGALAAASTLAVCLAVGVVGWYVTDAGAHGVPRDGLRVGALGWLMAHGSGVSVRGVPISVVPLGMTAVCAWVTWRLGHRVGDSISGHGPDAVRLADGERDFTVPAAVAGYAAGYALVTAVTGWLASTPTSAPDLTRAVGFSLALAVLFGGPAIAVGSGRAAIWARHLPPGAVATATGALRILGCFLLASSTTLVLALVLDLHVAANVVERLHPSVGEGLVLTLLTAAFLPNAALFAGSFLLGPGFAVGTGTLVSPVVVVLGPLPLFPLVAALPDAGTPRAWVLGLVAVPVVLAAVAAALNQRRHRTSSWFDGALRGCSAGVVAGMLVGALAAVSGGAAGPGRLRDVAPFALDVTAHAVAALGVGGLLGALVMTFLQRREATRAAR